MPRHGLTYDDDLAEVRGDFDDDYDNDITRPKGPQPTSKRAKQLQESNPFTCRRIQIPQSKHRLIVGPSGRTVTDLTVEFDCVVDVPPRHAKDDTVVVEGKQNDVQRCVAKIESIIKEDELAAARTKSGKAKDNRTAAAALPALPGQESVKILVHVEKFAHRRIIGPGSKHVKDLQRRLETKDESVLVNKNRNVNVSIPDREDASEVITVTVPAFLLQDARKHLREFFEYYDITPHVKETTIVEDATAAAPSTSAPSMTSKPAEPATAEAGEGEGKGGRRKRGGRGKKDAAPAEATTAPTPASTASAPAIAPAAAAAAMPSLPGLPDAPALPGLGGAPTGPLKARGPPAALFGKGRAAPEAAVSEKAKAAPAAPATKAASAPVVTITKKEVAPAAKALAQGNATTSRHGSAGGRAQPTSTTAVAPSAAERPARKPHGPFVDRGVVGYTHDVRPQRVWCA